MTETLAAESDLRVPTKYSHRTALGHISSSFLARVGGSAALAPPSRRLSEGKKRGLKFEAQALTHIKETFPKLIIQPEFLFRHEGRTERAIPDGIILTKHQVIAIECKYTHTYDGYNQLTHLYKPVLRRAYPRADIVRLEVCKIYDPTIKLPEPISIINREWDTLRGWLDNLHVVDVSYGLLILRL